jgi:hypothetical protein
LRENGLLQILSFANQVFHAMAVTDSDDVLGDDWTLIKRCRNIVRRGPYHFHPPARKPDGKVGLRRRPVKNCEGQVCPVREGEQRSRTSP